MLYEVITGAGAAMGEEAEVAGTLAAPLRGQSGQGADHGVPAERAASYNFV